MTKKSGQKRVKEPGGVDDLFVYITRMSDPNFMANDPRFSKEAKERRDRKGMTDSRRNFEQRYAK